MIALAIIHIVGNRAVIRVEREYFGSQRTDPVTARSLAIVQRVDNKFDPQKTVQRNFLSNFERVTESMRSDNS